MRVSTKWIVKVEKNNMEEKDFRIVTPATF